MKTINDNQIAGIQQKLAQIRATAHHANEYLQIVSKIAPPSDQETIARLSKCLTDSESNSNQIGKELEGLKKTDSN